LQFSVLPEEEQDKIRESKIIDLFRHNLQKNKKWHKKWNERLYFLNEGYPYKKKDIDKTVEYISNIYNKKDELGYIETDFDTGNYIVDENPKGSLHIEDKKRKLWGRLDWWKKW
jgi:hypothetical protein